MVIGADSDAEKTGAILKVPPDHHWVVVVPTNVTVRPSRMVEGPNGLDWEAGCTLGLTAVRTVSLVCSNRRGHPVPVGVAASAAA